jgi:antitoxin (DNA-binding transcriptional repressor) of toxin-antitoxin stability system
MKYIATRDLRNNPSAIWETLDEGSEVVVTVNGKPKAIMIKADDDLEFLMKAITRAKAELAVERMRLQSLRLGLDRLSSEEIESEISKSRQEDR